MVTLGFSVQFETLKSSNSYERKWDCSKCKSKESVLKGVARKRLQIFSLTLPLSTRPVWKCRKCGWNKAVELNGKFPESPLPSGELNPLYRVAEGWYVPPAVVDEQPTRMPPTILYDANTPSLSQP
ncbi:hypothetical protein VKT23_011517 [Stygiomarasmius scandens]|uniref:Uncharacterized protein n=1 Tax=Marasmiellus scandens TaxID=2682957 RepID=A0ABR1J991_9AGAR